MPSDRPCILLRKSLAPPEEASACLIHTEAYTHRGDVPDNRLVIPRYALLPFPEEVHHDLEKRGCELANTVAGHHWIASFLWYEDLKDYTFQSWFELPRDDSCYPIVIKGRTNSRKMNWRKLMFAKDRAAAIEVSGRLLQDPQIAEQGLVYRRYEPLKAREEGLHGLPFTEEYRFFFWDNQLIGGSYYWAIAEDIDGDVPSEAATFARECAEIARQRCRFFVLDVALKEDGSWVLVEVNDGQQSGLALLDPEPFYRRLMLAATPRRLPGA